MSHKFELPINKDITWVISKFYSGFIPWKIIEHMQGIFFLNFIMTSFRIKIVLKPIEKKLSLMQLTSTFWNCSDRDENLWLYSIDIWVHLHGKPIWFVLQNEKMLTWNYFRYIGYWWGRCCWITHKTNASWIVVKNDYDDHRYYWYHYPTWSVEFHINNYWNYDIPTAIIIWYFSLDSHYLFIFIIRQIITWNVFIYI